MECVDCGIETEQECNWCSRLTCNECRIYAGGDLLCNSCYDEYLDRQDAEDEDWEPDDAFSEVEVQCETVTDD